MLLLKHVPYLLSLLSLQSQDDVLYYVYDCRRTQLNDAFLSKRATFFGEAFDVLGRLAT